METLYKNARPSLIANLGLDVVGAKRHNFDTYDVEQKEKKEREKKYKNEISENNKKFSKEILKENPDKDLVIQIIKDGFKIKTSLTFETARDYLGFIRKSVCTIEQRKDFNSKVTAYNSTNRKLSEIKYNFDYFVKKEKQKRIKDKNDDEICKTGNFHLWKNHTNDKLDDSIIDYMKENCTAIQFGNTVTDLERAYLLTNLKIFLEQVKVTFPSFDLKKISWSFGARGKAGSVAYYQPTGNIISVNRDNIGSLIHELGHYLDYENNLISHQIDFGTIIEYKKTLLSRGLKFSDNRMKYYLSPKEIFARAFEAYCITLNVFDEFALSGTDKTLPILNENLLSIVKGVINESIRKN